MFDNGGDVGHYGVMAKRTDTVHVAITRRHYKGKVYETTLLRAPIAKTAR